MIDIDEALPLHTQVELLNEAVVQGNTGPELFSLSGKGLVTVVIDDENDEWSFHSLRYDALNSFLRQWARPTKTTTRQGVQTTTELAALNNTLVRAYAERGSWRGVPRLDRAADAPVVRPDLTVRWEAGFDKASRTYVIKGGTPTQTIFPSAEGAASAAAWLLRWFDPFALQFQESRADALALAMTPLLMSYTRKLSEANTPGGLITATEKGSGKTELTKLISVMGSGTRVHASTWPTGSEQSKQVISILRAGQAVALFDNVKAGLDSDVLEALLTGRSMSSRLLGTQENIEVLNDTLWLFTSNAPSVSPDMLRRLVLIPLLKRGSTAVWDPQVLIKAERARKQIVTAMIMMISHWRDIGAPDGSVALSGYEQWSLTLSGILEAASVKGFAETRQETLGVSVSTDEEDEGHMVERIARIMGTDAAVRWTTRELWDNVHDMNSYGSMLDADRQAVRSWLDASTSSAKNPIMAAGRKLGAIARREFTGVQFRVERYSNPANSYGVVLRDAPEGGVAEAVGVNTDSMSGEGNSSSAARQSLGDDW